jgi:broad specificity phosphatase PhoE
VASRLVLVAHGPTTRTRDLVFGDRAGLEHPELIEAETHRVSSWSSGPEPACFATAERLGGAPDVVSELAQPDFGGWDGRSLAEVGAEDPAGLGRWLSDPADSPHGGESLAQLVTRVGAYCDERDWPPGGNVVVVAPLVARAAVAHALGAGPEVIFRVDVAPLGRVGLSRQGPHWRLQQLG